MLLSFDSNRNQHLSDCEAAVHFNPAAKTTARMVVHRERASESVKESDSL